MQCHVSVHVTPFCMRPEHFQSTGGFRKHHFRDSGAAAQLWEPECPVKYFRLVLGRYTILQTQQLSAVRRGEKNIFMSSCVPHTCPFQQERLWDRCSMVKSGYKSKNIIVLKGGLPFPEVTSRTKKLMRRGLPSNKRPRLILFSQTLGLMLLGLHFLMSL